MPTVLVTSSNRGIGLEFVRQYAAAGWRVIAACRDPEGAAELGRIAAASDGRVEPVALDVTDMGSIARVAAASDAPLDLLINSAGIGGRSGSGPGEIDYRDWARVLDVNLMGPVRVLDAFADRLAAGERPRAVTITSGMGSIADAGSDSSLAYRTSKAAVNMAMRARSFSLRPRGVTVIVMNPGWVRTDMGGPRATKSPEESIAQMRRVIDRLTPEQTGSFLNYDGRAYAW
jgi:NAD(P)-dependent dehydrogenase (short-subunit alcohol dehydrogenase family)